MDPEQLLNNLGLWIGLCLTGVVVCFSALIAITLFSLISLKHRAQRQAARAWLTAQGRVVESKIVRSRAAFIGLTFEELKARARAQKELPKDGPERALAIALGLLDDPVDLVLDQIIEPQINTDQFPFVAYEYEVAGVKYLNNLVRVDDVDRNESGGSYSRQVINRYPVGATVTVYYNPQNPRQSALER